MQFTHLLLRLHEAFGDGVAHQLLAAALEGCDLRVGQRHGTLLLLLQFLAFGDHLLVLAAGALVAQEGLNPLTGENHAGLIQDGLAKLLGLADDGGLFGFVKHNILV